MNYQEFLERKTIIDIPTGFECGELNQLLFDWQKDIVRWACRRGRSALFEGCGLGKTIQYLEWSKQVCAVTGGDVLSIAPLAVSKQTQREGEKFGYSVNICSSQDDVKPGINITNYEKLHRFDTSKFSGVVADESGIMKSFSGKIKQQMCEMWALTQYRLSCTATPSPNDYEELGNQAEFLGVCTRSEMLAMFFINDTANTGTWRLKKHAEKEFWRWVCSWAVMIQKPSDLGYNDDGFILPGLEYIPHVIEDNTPRDGYLFAPDAKTLTERRSARKGSLDDKLKIAADLVNNSDEQWIVWCDMNIESEKLAAVINGAVEVTGSDTDEQKHNAVSWFLGYDEDDLVLTGNKVIRRSSCPGKKNTTKQEEKNTKKTKNTETRESPKEEHLLKTLNISGSIGKKNQRCLSETENSKTRLTQTEENDTQTIKSIEKNTKSKLKNTSSETLTSDSTNVLESMVSPQTNIDQSLKSKVEGVPYADQKIQDALKKKDSMLTIATKQEQSEDCCVSIAIKDSVSLKTTENYLPKHRSTSKRVLVSKAKIFGYGLNLQNCHNMIFFGLSDSFEAMYQAVRRCYRFGQKEKVNVHIITHQTEGAVVRNIQRKEKSFESMSANMTLNMADITKKEINAKMNEKVEYTTNHASGDGWECFNEDCIDVVKRIPTDSIHYMIYSPPFASLFTYSNSNRDMGNVRTAGEFFEHFSFLAGDLYRVLMPGRLMSFHVMNLPATITHDGYIGMKDFRGDLIRLFESVGFIYHSEVCIWKDPLVQATRTKVLTLAHKQISKDSSRCSQGFPDYVVTMRKKGTNPEPVSKGRGFEQYIGEMDEPTAAKTDDPRGNKYSHHVWQRYASPVWFDISQTRTLNVKLARDKDDERHMCPLSLDVIERCIELWTNPGDTVLSPFTGIGSEGYCALNMGRKFIGMELKPSYFKVAIRNLTEAAAPKKQMSLF